MQISTILSDEAILQALGERLAGARLARNLTQAALAEQAGVAKRTVERLEANDVRVHCLALGGVDLTSAAGKMTMQVIAAVAEFERDLLIERTQSGISRARAQGKRFGRPLVLNGEQRTLVLQRLVAGTTVAQVAKEFATSRQTIMRVRDAMNVHLHADDDERHSAIGATSAPSPGLPASIA